MGLFERMAGTEMPKIRVDQFEAALDEWERGRMTRAQVLAGFSVQPSEEADLDALFARNLPTPETISIGGFVTLTNVGAAYDAINASKGLGAFLVQTFGITQVELRVGVSYVGTGVQSWQLWNVTDGVEATRFDDSGPVGDKVLTWTFTPASPLGPGEKLFRLRCKSTVAADDPLYYGATVLFYRAARWNSITLHQVMALAEKGIAPYDTPTALRNRCLGL